MLLTILLLLLLLLMMMLLLLLLLLFFLNPLKMRVEKKLKKLRKNGEANVPSGCPTQNCCATKQN